MRTLLYISLLSLLAISSNAQSDFDVYGVVSDEKGPVNGATVTLTALGDAKPTVTVYTSADGSYGVRVPQGKYRVHAIRYIDHVTLYSNTETVTVLSGRPRSVNFHLSLTGFFRETVTVAAGEHQTIEQVSKTVDVISGQEMRDRADFSLAESLRTIPGFRIQQLGGFGRTASIKTRGLRNQDTAILLDGIRFRDPASITGDATPFLSDITLTSVSEVEVLRGSGTSLYGTNAIGGVVDFQTPSARKGTHGQIGGAVGGLGLGRFRGNISHGLDDGKFGIGAGLSRTVYTKGIDGDDDAHNTNFQTRVDADPFSKTSLSGRIFFSDARGKLNSNPETLGDLPPTGVIIDAEPFVNFTPDANDPDDLQRSRFFTGQLTVDHVLTNELVLSGYYQGLTTRRSNDSVSAGFGTSTTIFDGNIHTGNTHVNWTPVRENTLTAGYEFELENFGNEGITPFGADDFFTKARQQSHTFYAQDLISLIDGRLQIAGGVRMQKFSLSDPRFSLANAPYSDVVLDSPPTAVTVDGSVSYFFRRSDTKVRAHVGNGYRVPSLYERFGTFFSTFAGAEFVALGDPFLKPEKSIAVDAGIEQTLVNDRVRLSSTYFYTQLSDIIGFGNSVPDIGSTVRPFGGYENQKGGIARGGEFSVKAKPSRSTDLFASYTYTNSDQRTPQISGTGILSSLAIPDHQVTLVATQRFDRFWVNFDLLVSSSYLAPIFSSTTFNTHVYRFDGSRRGDMTGGYTFAIRGERMTLRIYGTVENIFDHEYYENGFRTVGRTARGGVTFGF